MIYPAATFTFQNRFVERRVHELADLDQIERLQNIVEYAEPQCFERALYRGVGRHDDRLCAGICGKIAPYYLETTAIGEFEIDQHDIEPIRFEKG